jgi:hypothetical protein
MLATGVEGAIVGGATAGLGAIGGKALKAGASTLMEGAGIRAAASAGKAAAKKEAASVVGDLTRNVFRKGPSDAAEGAAAVDAVRAKGEELAKLPSSKRPGAAEALKIRGHDAIVAVSDMGAGTRRVNPMVQDILDSIPAAARGNNHGGCGFVECLTQALDKGLDPTGGRGAAVFGRSSGNASFLKLQPPCDSCQVLADHFKIPFATEN